MLEHARLLARWFGEDYGVRGFRKHASWYTKGFRDSKALRVHLSVVRDLEELEELLAEIDRDETVPDRRPCARRAARAAARSAWPCPRAGSSTSTTRRRPAPRPRTPPRAASCTRAASGLHSRRDVRANWGQAHTAAAPKCLAMQAPLGLPSGSIVADRYELTGELGRGERSIVYSARDRRTGTDVALKLLALLARDRALRPPAAAPRVRDRARARAPRHRAPARDRRPRLVEPDRDGDRRRPLARGRRRRGRAAPPRSRRAAGRRDRRSALRGAPLRRRPPRREAREHPARRGRPRAARRLRLRAARGPGAAHPARGSRRRSPRICRPR